MTHPKLTFSEYIKGKRIAVIGAGISNRPLVQLFITHGCKSVAVRDKKQIDPDVMAEFISLGASVLTGDDYLENIEADLVIRTPGMRPDMPQLLDLKKNGTRVVGETQLFLQFAPCKVFGVTGSDGKTTTTTLISKLLETTGKKVYLGGNIGKPLLPLIDEIHENDYACLELSSFQLMDGEFSPDVSLITNISENHLDWHHGMEEYIEAKSNIFSHQSKKGILVLNADDPHAKRYSEKAKGNVRFFSLKNVIENGAYLQNDILILQRSNKSTPLWNRSEIRIPGLYNTANYLAAISAVMDEISPENILPLARSFRGVEHRVEWIRELNGINFYNSSIDSSPARTIATLGAFPEKLTVICGGYDKKLDYSVLKEHFVKKVKAVYTTGQTAPKILAALEDPTAPYSLTCCYSLREALQEAYKNAQKGDIIILSPASASFDAFKNFEERGRFFKNMVMELL